MITIEAKTLDEAYSQAAEQLECSVLDVDSEIVQYPSSGFFGFFTKNAIIKAKKEGSSNTTIKKENKTTKVYKERTKPVRTVKKSDNRLEPRKKREPRAKENRVPREKVNIEDIDLDSALATIEKDVKNLFSTMCFNIEVVSIKMFNEKTVEIKFDGEDAALMIGKDGYRYKALSYILFNWINPKYGLLLRLEVAEFLKNQEEMIMNYLEPIKENINNNGRGQTRILDGVLVQIALKELRTVFPDKYVAIKTSRDGGKFIVVNDFVNKRS